MDQYSFAVIVGRFQVSDLHIGHRHLIDTAMQINDRLLIVITVIDAEPSNRNPLDRKTRELMLQQAYPNAVIRWLFDMPSDEAWSEALDKIITGVTSDSPATIYTAEHSFLDFYVGEYETKRINKIHSISGTEDRIEAAKLPLADANFRRGIIYCATNRYPASYQTIDIIVDKPETGEVLLGKRDSEKKWRFVGGFVDTLDQSLEQAAERESSEETGGIIVGEPQYIGSMRIDDFRYLGTADGIMTSIFRAPCISGTPKATDDLSDIGWFKPQDVEGLLVENHHKIWLKVKHRFIKQENKETES